MQRHYGFRPKIRADTNRPPIGRLDENKYLRHRNPNGDSAVDLHSLVKYRPSKLFLSDKELSGVDEVCRVVMTIIAIYLVCIELLAWCGHFRTYIKAPSRLFNIVAPATILINVFQGEGALENFWFWTVQTWAALTIWMRLLLYLRAVSLNYGYMVRMISGVSSGMVPFLLIFFFGVCAFADAFESISSVLHLNGDIELPAGDPDAIFYVKYLQNYIIVW